MAAEHHKPGLLHRAVHMGETVAAEERKLLDDAVHAGEDIATREQVRLHAAVHRGEVVEHQLVDKLEGIREGRPLEEFQAVVAGDEGFTKGARDDAVFWHDVAPDTPRGPQFLFIHGLGLDHRVWRFQQLALAHHHRVVSIDLRGHGRSAVPDYALRPSEGTAVDIANVLVELDMHDVIVVGHSMGGMSAIQFVVDRRDLVRERVAGLVGLSTSGSGRNLLSSRLMRPFRAVAGLFDKLVLGEGVKKIVGLRALPVTDSGVGMFAFREMFGENAEEGAVLFSRELVDAFTPEGMQQSLDAIFHFELLERLGEIQTPTLIVHGTRDLLLPLEEAELLAEGIDHAHLVRVPRAGHMIMYEDSDFLSELLESFAHEVTDPR